MLRLMCKSKLHRLVVTQTELHYEDSLTLDEALIEAADLRPFEMVQVVNEWNKPRGI